MLVRYHPLPIVQIYVPNIYLKLFSLLILALSNERFPRSFVRLCKWSSTRVTKRHILCTACKWWNASTKVRFISCRNWSFVRLFTHYKLTFLLLLQPDLQPLWVLACSTIVEYSQQEGFYRVPLPAARQTPNLEDQLLERSNSRHRESPTSETTQANPSSGRWSNGREISENFAESGCSHVTFGFFYMP